MRIARIALTSAPWLTVLLFVAALAFLLLGRTERTVEAPGEVRVREYRIVRPEVPGLIAAVLVEPGDRVHRGDELARLRDPEEEQGLAVLKQSQDEARNRLRALRRQHHQLAELIHPLLLARENGVVERGALEAALREIRTSELEIQLRAARDDEDRARELAAAGLVSAQALRAATFDRLEAEQRHRGGKLEEKLERRRQAERGAGLELLRREQTLALLNLESEIAEVEVQLERWRVEREELEKAERKRHLDAPIDGVVVSAPARELLGRAAEPGEQLLTIVDVDSVYFLSWVSEQAIVKVRDGQRVKIEIAGLPRQRYSAFDGEVSRVAADPTSNPSGGSNRYAVEIRLRDPSVALEDGRFVLRSGMSGTAEIAFEHRVPLLYALRDFLRAG